MYNVLVRCGAYFRTEVELGQVGELDYSKNKFMKFLVGAKPDTSKLIIAYVYDENKRLVRRYDAKQGRIKVLLTDS